MRKSFRADIAYKLVLAGLLLMIPLMGTADTDRAKSLGSHLMCICGCGQLLTECNHIHCPSSVPMMGELKEKLASGMSDSQVNAAFVDKYGKKVLAAPPFSGIFNVTAWLASLLALLAGGAGLIFYLRRMKMTQQPHPMQTTSHVASPYDQKIEDELNKFTPED